MLPVMQKVKQEKVGIIGSERVKMNKKKVYLNLEERKRLKLQQWHQEKNV